MDMNDGESIPSKPYSFSFQLSKADGPQEELIVLPLMAKEAEDLISSYADDPPISGSSRDPVATVNRGRSEESAQDGPDMKSVLQEPSEDVYTKPPRQFKFNRQPHHFYWYSTAGQSKLDAPPPFPAEFTLQQDVIFAHRVLGCHPERVQTWWRRSEGDTPWATIQQGDALQFHGIMYHLTVSPTGDVSWVLPDTFKKQKRVMAKLQKKPGGTGDAD